ncbi:mannose-6-phosphate isomerase, class I [Sansalvadorimonas sp. 2012CJ34-2]|uniref:mannose-6-phosphate isomerase n=1 Tax=Parendozoicomonas callyspongiae TaxID=2942213 RepID=A0ABT0PFL7_9GAMM|nr:mannose-6-phosphate isomerase, class I [Sansalvadorimonas sp. 2012CJ34-2]MCL6270164.1 mannose-6-phosphate isomerase, class I [Sansalvadorimonas sp. 2012CJ34-2]
MSIFKLENPIQHYEWGNIDAVTKLFGINNPDHKPLAEIWMGAHPKAPSSVNNCSETLCDLLARKPELLGNSSIEQFGPALPFLFKVLFVAKPLSIQAHPNKQQALEGFARENTEGIPVNAPNRNYRDNNHKPELVYALTAFKAMNGFRSQEEIIRLFRMADLQELEQALLKLEESANLKQFYQSLMTLPEQIKQNLMSRALSYAAESKDPAWQEVQKLSVFHPGDIGVLSPLLLNIITLAPGEAMFLKEGTLHAYLEGTAMEIMACSDNVLRGGLTPKHVDIDELLKAIKFTTSSYNALKTSPLPEENGETRFPVPANDFAFSVIDSTEASERFQVSSAEILFCLDGYFTISHSNETLQLSQGQSCFIGADAGSYKLEGTGRVARASSTLT